MAASMAPLSLSVVIPTHDTRELTLKCLDALYAAWPERAGMEVILVDDASRDGTAEAARSRHPGVLVLRHETAERFTRAANAGLARARGEILLLLNSDTEVVPGGGLARLVARFAEDPRLGIAGALLHYPDGAPQWSGGREPTLLWFFALATGLPALLARLPFYRRARPLAPAGPTAVDWVTGAAMAIRRQAWEMAGPLDEGFRFYAQDLDFCLRARRAGWRVEIHPGFPVLHHHGATIGRDPAARDRQHLELLWSDLLRWARKHRGTAWGNRAAAVLRTGARLRLAARCLAWTVARPFLAAPRRAAWSADDHAVRRALAAIRPCHPSP
jgi:GT2 family glycosyltransferase